MKRFAPLIVILLFTFAITACAFGPSITFENPFTSSPTLPATSIDATSVASTQQPDSANQGANNSATPVTVSSSSLDGTLVDLYARLSPGVVSITILTDQGGAQGSGFVYDKKGHIITNDHVVQGANSIEVDFASGFKAAGNVIGTDLDSDLAVIEVKAPDSELIPLVMGDSNTVKVGQSVIALGNPFGLSGTMTYGIVSAKGRTLDTLRQDTVNSGHFLTPDNIQTDAAVNPGNSGGPLLNLKGEVIGINREIQTSGVLANGEPGNIGISFAIPINIVKRVVPILISSGKYTYPYLGVSFSPDLTLADIDALGLPQQTGVYVADVTAGGPGDQAGLQAGKTKTNIQGFNSGGDLVIGVDGHPVLSYNDLIGYVLTNKSPGDKISLTIIRDNQKKEVTLTLGKRP
jgi:S1-C subfamily serine protease